MRGEPAAGLPRPKPPNLCPSMPTLTLPTFRLDDGTTLHDVPVAYASWGRLDEGGTNAAVVCHALTGSADAADWWGPLVGPGRALDTDRLFVVCCNVPGSPYGSVSPRSTDPTTGASYGPDFPAFTTRDTVRLHYRVLRRLGVRRVALAVGGSMGGMHVLEWGFARAPDGTPFVRALVPVAVNARHAAWQIGISEAQRQAIYADPRWDGGRYHPADPPKGGLAAARMMAMISYRTHASFEDRFGRDRMPEGDAYAVESYLRYQGQKLADRFDAGCYVALTRQMDTHDVGRGRGSCAEALARLQQPALVVGIDSDVLYPLAEQHALAEQLPHGELAVLPSPHGHDAFLIEFDRLAALLQPWIDRHVLNRLPAAATP